MAAKPKDAAAASPCQRGAEMGRPGGLLRVRAGTTLECAVYYCGTSGALRIQYRAATEDAVVPVPLVEQDVPPPPSPVKVAFPAGSEGLYLLTWDLLPFNPTWEATVEVSADEILKFRIYKSDKSKYPRAAGFLIVAVFP